MTQIQPERRIETCARCKEKAEITTANVKQIGGANSTVEGVTDNAECPHCGEPFDLSAWIGTRQVRAVFPIPPADG